MSKAMHFHKQLTLHCLCTMKGNGGIIMLQSSLGGSQRAISADISDNAFLLAQQDERHKAFVKYVTWRLLIGLND